MEIKLYNTLPVLRSLYTEKEKSAKRLPQFLELCKLPTLQEGQEFRNQGIQDYDILFAIRSDGMDIIEAQQQYGLFNPTRDLKASKWCYDEYFRVDIDQIISKWAKSMKEVLPQKILPDFLKIVILLADCANEPFMVQSSGLSCYGRVPGYLLLRIWPSMGNAEKLPIVLTRSFLQGIRRYHLSTKLISLQEAIEMEGVIALMIEDMFPDKEFPWLSNFIIPNDWNDALINVAKFYDTDSYSDLTVNTYGWQKKVGDQKPPIAKSMTLDELEYAKDLIWGQLESSDPNIVAACLYGDDFVSPQGFAQMGLPPLSGFEIGYRLAKNYKNEHNVTTESMILKQNFISKELKLF